MSLRGNGDFGLFLGDNEDCNIVIMFFCYNVIMLYCYFVIVTCFQLNDTCLNSFFK